MPPERAAAGWLHRIHTLNRAQLFVLALVLGCMAALALPPLGWIIFLIPAFSGLVLLMERPNWQGAFAIGWFFGLGHFAAGFYWVGHAFFVDAAVYGWLAPIAVGGLAAGMAVFPALALSCAYEFSGQLRLRSWARVLALAGFWSLTEWLRGEVLTGFPWNLIGSVWVVSDAMIQSAAWIGVFGLGTLTIAAVSLPALLAQGVAARDLCAGFSGLALLAVLWGAGYARLPSEGVEFIPDVTLRLVQPNIPQHLKWKPDLRISHVKKQLDMSRQASADNTPPTHVIWAETAVPFNLSGDLPLQKALGSAAPPDGLLITGAPRNADGSQTLWNSAHAITPAGVIVATYDKQHLVPFGEYVPFRHILKFSKLTAGRLDFTPGTGARSMEMPGLPAAAMLICYEVIFPDEVPGHLQSGGPRPGWLLNITNDAWFGISAGPYQHLAAARLRAVEHGLPLIRVANTGISAAIDPYGRIVQSLALGEPGVLDVGLARALPQTVFGQFGGTMTWLVLLLAMAIAAGCGRRGASG